MFRVVLEFVLTILAIIVARAVLSSVLKGISNASYGGHRPPPPQAPTGASTTSSASAGRPGGELHKDPVCGTYVTESTAFRRQAGGQTFYYCSDACREKHSLVAR